VLPASAVSEAGDGVRRSLFGLTSRESKRTSGGERGRSKMGDFAQIEENERSRSFLPLFALLGRSTT
jgi:hypothetical protein